MNNVGRNIFVILFFLISSFSFSQDISVLSNKTFKFSGKNNPSDLEFYVPPGFNRYGIITVFIERKHSRYNGDNHPTSNFINGDSFFKINYVQNNILNNALAYKAYWGYSSNTSEPTLSNAGITNYMYSYIILESSLLTGNLKLNFGNLTTPRDEGDEIIVNLTILENVDQGYYPTTRGVKSTIKTVENNLVVEPENISIETPLGANRDVTEKFYLGYSYLSTEDNLTVENIDYKWKNLLNEKIVNGLGSKIDVLPLEPNGISARIDYLTNLSNHPSLTTNRSSKSLTNFFFNAIYELNPIGFVNFSGNVFYDIKGNIDESNNRTGKAANFINFSDSKGIVIAVAPINSDGSFIVNEGKVYQGVDIISSISIYKGVIGLPAPPVVLNPNWKVVNVNKDKNKVDGLNTFKIYSKTTYFNEYRYGVDFDGVEDLDFDNDGILNEIECKGNDVIINGDFKNLQNLSYWNVNGNYLLNSNGLEFKSDNASITSLKQSMNSKNLKNGKLKLNGIKWLKSSDNSSNASFKFELFIGGTRYLLIENKTGETPLVTAENNAVSTLLNLSPVYTIDNNYTEKQDLILALPDTNNLHQGEIEIKFTAGASTNSDDLAIESISLFSCSDTDNDGIQDLYDLDSDNDGCFDAVEGSGNISNNLLNSDGSINASDDENGIPVLVNGGQLEGSAYDALINACQCLKEPNLSEQGLSTFIGISTVGQTKGWPNEIKGAHIALQSYDKGLVINDFTNSEIPNIKNPLEGMIIYSKDDNCLKIYSKDVGKETFSWKCFTKQSCEDN